MLVPTGCQLPTKPNSLPQELVVDLAEQEPEPATPDASPPAGGGAAGVLRKWWGGKGEPWNQAV